jgi:superfamily II DNA or RNA helicase
MSGHYKRSDHGFRYFVAPGLPRWREPQVGALSALLAHWSVHDEAPALLSLPTGAGKTAVATAVPYLTGATRVLVLVPSKQLRAQLAEAFSSQSVLRDIDALSGNFNPRVLELKGMGGDWSEVIPYDVVVALPSAISPAQHTINPPPTDLFDTLIIDEAHHSPAPTWRAVLDHYASASRILLTATPKRRDGQRVPGEIAYHYPLGRAITDGIYKPVQPEVLDLPATGTREACDVAIAKRVVDLARDPTHATSTLLIRVASAHRARSVANTYRGLGLDPAVLLSSLGQAKQEQIIAGLQDQTIRAVVVVGMLGEGFDLPSLRLAAYHDKHKSAASTIQLIGRLVRADIRFPQPSVLVTVNDGDTYPALRGSVRSLYEEDADWSVLLPGIIDADITEALADREFASRLSASPPEISIDAVRPLIRASFFEVPDTTWTPDLAELRRQHLNVGASLKGGQQVFYATVLPGATTLLLVTQSTDSPRWHHHAGLDGVRFDLHLLTWRAPRHAGEFGLLMLNSDNGDVRRSLVAALEPPVTLRTANPDRLHHLFDSLSRVSVSNVGVRTTQTGGRSTAYRTFAGSRVDRGIRDVDTSQGAIGHAMAQVSRGPGESAYNVGIAVEKSKIWESRYVPLREYEDVMRTYGDQYWSANVAGDPLLPAVTRGSRLTSFPASEVVLAELDHRTVDEGWTTLSGLSLSEVDVQAAVSADRSHLGLALTRQDTGESLWTGTQATDGSVRGDEPELFVQRGYGTQVSFAEHLVDHPLTIFFRNSTTTHGPVVYERPGVQKDISRILAVTPDWTGTNIEAETDATAQKTDSGQSVQSFVVARLMSTPTFHTHRWILHNDGGGEIADIFTIEVNPGADARLKLWHVKPSGGWQPTARVPDLEVVVAQAIKSRRWFSDPDFWRLVLRRLDPGAGTRVRVLEGEERLLRQFLSPPTSSVPWTLDSARPVLQGEINIVQPGLSWSTFASRLATGDQSAVQIRDLLTAFDDAVSGYASTSVMCAT